ncbi:hypothetical protein EHP00_1312 [Ecytonucleospora hepatopenaei]|uniref:G domain-containing protein n=1 Tax=Ecytonucleospora hepatopenaei TaxID=646526 RepID=A0A1W0E5E8_9MICR|nr:hypothetical protein EHP00_1312 [Ecytonucleospora hepatopenaei]
MTFIMLNSIKNNFNKVLFTNKIVLAFLMAMLLGLVTFRIFVKFSRKKKCRKIFFVGPRKTGKTTAINAMLDESGENYIGMKKKTVPTRKDHRVVFKPKKTFNFITTLNNFEIIEKHQKDDEDDIKKFSINSTDKYIFFIKDDQEVYPALAGFDVTFVKWQKCSDHKNKYVTYLEENPMKLFELIYEVSK